MFQYMTLRNFVDHYYPGTILSKRSIKFLINCKKKRRESLNLRKLPKALQKLISFFYAHFSSYTLELIQELVPAWNYLMTRPTMPVLKKEILLRLFSMKIVLQSFQPLQICSLLCCSKFLRAQLKLDLYSQINLRNCR